VSNATVALLFALGSSAWIYKQMSRGHGNQGTALSIAGVVFVLGFVVVFTLAHSLLH
jgi:hypothetical protein